MQMEVVVAVDVIKGEPGIPVGLKLGADLSFQLFADAGPESILETGFRRMIRKHPPGIGKIGYRAGREDGAAFDQDQMQSHVKRWEPSRALHGVRCRSRADHEAGRGQDPTAMTFADCLIDGERKPEIVAVDDHPFH